MTDIKTWNETLTKFISLYPDDPADGSPYFTGTENFGLDPRYKRLAAISKCPLIYSIQSLTRDFQPETCFSRVSVDSKCNRLVQKQSKDLVAAGKKR